MAIRLASLDTSIPVTAPATPGSTKQKDLPLPASTPHASISGNLKKTVSISDNPKVEKTASAVLKTGRKNFRKALLIALGIVLLAMAYGLGFLGVFLILHGNLAGIPLLVAAIVLVPCSLFAIGISRSRIENNFTQ